MLSCILVVILSVFTCVFVFSSNLQDTMNQQAYSQTMLLVHILETSKDDPVTVLEKIKNEIYGRITFMDENGKVLYDSDYDIAQMEIGVSADVHRQGDPQPGSYNGHGGHQAGKSDLSCGDGFQRGSLLAFFSSIAQTGYK